MTQTPLAIYKWPSFVDSSTFLTKGFCQLVTQIYNARQHIAIFFKHARLHPTHQTHISDFIFQISDFWLFKIQIWNLKSEILIWLVGSTPASQPSNSNFRFQISDFRYGGLALQARLPPNHQTQISDFRFRILDMEVWLFKQPPTTHSHTEFKFQISDFRSGWSGSSSNNQSPTRTPNSDFRFQISDFRSGWSGSSSNN